MADKVFTVLTVVKEMMQGQFDNRKSQLLPGNIGFIKQRYLGGLKSSVKLRLFKAGAVKNIHLIDLRNVEQSIEVWLDDLSISLFFALPQCPSKR